ncbi:MAG TPA: galactokinase family protein, partial [Spirochaetales bacterium]|nr:galactokinase family protein [Spirochaetales bacterium]
MMHTDNSLCSFPSSPDGKQLLEKLYGAQARPEQSARWETLVRKTDSLFGLNGARLFSSPGRTELGGNHSDHQGGRVLCAAVHLDMAACVVPTADTMVRLSSSGWPEPISVDLSDLSPRASEHGTPHALIRGVASALRARGSGLGGFCGAMDSLVPSGSGLSSSAAFELLIGQIFNALYNASSLPPVLLAQLGQEAENLHFGKPCGLMDQMACALGGVNAIDFKEAIPLWQRIDFDADACPYRLAILSSGGSHDNLTAEYAAIPAQM